MPRVIIADSSCLIVLDNIDELEILKKVYNEIVITSEISQEFGSELPEWVKIQDVQDKQKQKILEIDLDKGEASAIALCLELEDSLLIIDERKGRIKAKYLGLKITGTLGVILKAKELGKVNSVKELIIKLENQNFRIADSLKLKILKLSNEE